MESQFHGCAFIPFRLKGNRRLAKSHAEEVRIVSIMEHLITHRRQQPALYGSCPRRKSIKEEGVVGDVQVLKTMLSRLGVVPYDIAILGTACSSISTSGLSYTPGAERYRR